MKPITSLILFVAAAGAHAADDALPEMVKIPAGSFLMGSSKGEPGREGDEAPRRKVTIPRSFWVSKYEITEGQWAPCVAAKVCTPISRSLGSSHPVSDIRWKDAQVYIDWLSARTGKGYRFLTEAEWEYAARAGTETLYPFGNEITPANANYAASKVGAPQPVGKYAANRFGLHDMIGNVWEWVADCYDELGGYNAPTDGSAVTRATCEYHILRGGAYETRPEQLRSAYRNRAYAGGAGFGLRVATEVQP